MIYMIYIVSIVVNNTRAVHPHYESNSVQIIFQVHLEGQSTKEN